MTKQLTWKSSEITEENINYEVPEEEQTVVEVFEDFVNVQLKGPVCAETIDPIVNIILNLNLTQEDKQSPSVINLFIDTDGGDLSSAMRLIDVIRMSEIPIRTIGWGKVASAGLMIFMVGHERLFSENCSILSHNATFNASLFSVRVNDFSHQQEFRLVNERIMRIYRDSTGKDEKFIKKFLLRDNDVYLSAEEAIKNGLGDGFLPKGKGMTWLKTFSKKLDEVLTR